MILFSISCLGAEIPMKSDTEEENSVGFGRFFDLGSSFQQFWDFVSDFFGFSDSESVLNNATIHCVDCNVLNISSDSTTEDSSIEVKPQLEAVDTSNKVTETPEVTIKTKKPEDAKPTTEKSKEEEGDDDEEEDK